MPATFLTVKGVNEREIQVWVVIAGMVKSHLKLPTETSQVRETRNGPSRRPAQGSTSQVFSYMKTNTIVNYFQFCCAKKTRRDTHKT